MILDSTTITIQRTGDNATLTMQGRPMGITVAISREQLNELIGEFIRDATAWRLARRPDYYHTLGIDRTASTDDIKKAYRTLAKRYHPDGQVGDEARLKTINEAYAVLSDHEKRTQYEQSIS